MAVLCILASEIYFKFTKMYVLFVNILNDNNLYDHFLNVGTYLLNNC